MLETLVMFSNVQPQLQPHLPRAILVASPHQTTLDTPRRTYRAWLGDNSERPHGAKELMLACVHSDHAKYVSRRDGGFNVRSPWERREADDDALMDAGGRQLIG
jgi:hypothetical protein